jgi:hypothetical protein
MAVLISPFNSLLRRCRHQRAAGEGLHAATMSQPPHACIQLQQTNILSNKWYVGKDLRKAFFLSQSGKRSENSSYDIHNDTYLQFYPRTLLTLLASESIQNRYFFTVIVYIENMMQTQLIKQEVPSRNKYNAEISCICHLSKVVRGPVLGAY